MSLLHSSSRHMRLLLLSLCLLLLSLYSLTTVHAQKPPPVNNVTGDPIRMFAFAQIQFVSITKIDGVEQSFNCDFYMLSTWAAPKHDPSVTVDDDLVALKDEYWAPELDFINAIGGITALFEDPLSFVEEPLFDVQGLWGYTLPDDYIWCTLDQRYTGQFLTPVDMRRFPFDTQTVLLQIESLWDTTQVKIVFAEPAKINLQGLIPPTMPEIIGWLPQRVETTNVDILYNYNNRTYNRLILETVLNRDPTFFLDKIISGCAMLVVISIFLFLLNAEEADRVAIIAGIFASLVAYLFVTSAYTPVIPYPTALDKFLTLCFMMVLFMSITHGVMFLIRERQKLAEEAAEREEAQAEKDEEDDEGTDGEGALTGRSTNPELKSPSGNAAGGGDAGAHRVYIPHSGVVADDPDVHPLRIPASGHISHRSHGADKAAGDTGKPLNRRERKRARLAAAKAKRLAEPAVVPSSNPVIAAWQRLSWARKVDFIMFVAYSAVFIIGTAIILGAPQEEQKSAEIHH